MMHHDMTKGCKSDHDHFFFSRSKFIASLSLSHKRKNILKLSLYQQEIDRGSLFTENKHNIFTPEKIAKNTLQDKESGITRSRELRAWGK